MTEISQLKRYFMKPNKLIILLLLSLFTANGWTQPSDHGSQIILVSGATGTQGGAVARELVQRGYRVKGLTRNASSKTSQALQALGIEMIQGDFDDPTSLDKALEGAYGAFSVQQHRGVGIDGEIRQGKAFADAAKRSNIQHFIYTSAAKAPLRTGVPQFESKIVIEDHIKSLNIPYTIVRPATFMSTIETWRTDTQAGEFSGPQAPEFERVFIAPSDIGRFVAEAFDNPSEWLGLSRSIASDRATYQDIAAAISRIINKPVVYRQTPWEEFAASATPMALTATIWYRDNIDPIDVTALREEFPWLLTFDEYLLETGWGE